MSAIEHMELNTSDPKAAKRFYKAVFGWKFEDMKMPNGVYTMIQTDKGPLGGLQQHPMPGAPSQWLPYAGVASVARSLIKIGKQGGTVVVPRTEIPNMGAFGVFTDPQGATFAIWEPAKKAAKKKTAKKKTAKKKTAKKKAARKKAAKKATKRPAKKAARKKAAKKAAKRPAKKAAKKKATKKKATKKKATKKRAAKKR